MEETILEQTPKHDKQVIPTPISEEMKKAYLDYAMSVIVSRALPDVRDGLKPVQRRVIYAMYDQGITAASRHQKCAAVVGETMKRYHPHGDMSIYDTLVRMGQDFSLRYPLIDAQGNFGSIDGDPPAAMRYTECRLSKITDWVLKDIDKETVDFVPAYIPSVKEPALLPAALPNLVVNGTTGIAVGMATNIPPHNLNEVLEALNLLIDNPQADIKQIMQFIKGPDFPTRGIIYNKKDIQKAYETGRGGITMRAAAQIEELKGGKQQIIITELPYQVNKANLVAKIADLVRDGHIKGISDLRDESDRDGLRVVVELKRDAAAQRILNNLYKRTEMQTNFNCNFVALVNGTPQTLSLKTMLLEFINHRQVVIVRRSEYLLRKAKEREHILLGLKIAVDHIDEVIEIIKKSPSADEAKKRLIERFKLTEIQAVAILDMQLRRLAALERKKIEEELAQIQQTIRELEALLASKDKIMAAVKEEFAQLKEKFGDKRVTKVIPGEVGSFSEEELIKEEDVFITITDSGYIKRMPLATYKQQGRGGKGVGGGSIREGDEVNDIKTANTHDTMLFFTNKGNMFAQRVWEIPEASRQARGTAIVNLLNLKGGEDVVEIMPVGKDSRGEGFVLLTTRSGVVKKTPLSDFDNIRSSGIRAVSLREGDSLVSAKCTYGKNDLMLISAFGKSIRFSEKDVRPMGRTAAGVRGMKLGKEDFVITAETLDPDVKNVRILTVSEHGFGKTTEIEEYKLQGRGGSGILTSAVTKKTGSLVAAKLLDENTQDILLTSCKGQVIRLPAKDLPTLGRATQGVILMRLPKDDTVASVALL